MATWGLVRARKRSALTPVPFPIGGLGQLHRPTGLLQEILEERIDLLGVIPVDKLAPLDGIGLDMAAQLPVVSELLDVHALGLGHCTEHRADLRRELLIGIFDRSTPPNRGTVESDVQLLVEQSPFGRSLEALLEDEPFLAVAGAAGRSSVKPISGGSQMHLTPPECKND
jgi:hypothetical protein